MRTPVERTDPHEPTRGTSHNGAISAGSHDAMLDAAIDAVTTASEKGRVAVLQAVDNRTVRELNARVRADRITTGDVASAGVTVHDGLAAGVGDRIVTRRNHRRLVTADGFVRSGALWDVTAVLPDGAPSTPRERRRRAHRPAAGGLRRQPRRARLRHHHRRHPRA